jgi:hypothetical protein
MVLAAGGGKERGGGTKREGVEKAVSKRLRLSFILRMVDDLEFLFSKIF